MPKTDNIPDKEAPSQEADNIVYEFAKNATENVRVSIIDFRGRTYGDIRVYYRDEDGALKPSKKGITFAPDLIGEFEKGVEALERELIALGLYKPAE